MENTLMGTMSNQQAYWNILVVPKDWYLLYMRW